MATPGFSPYGFQNEKLSPNCENCNHLFLRRAQIPRIVFVPIQVESNSIKFPFNLNRLQLNSAMGCITGKVKVKQKDQSVLSMILVTICEKEKPN